MRLGVLILILIVFAVPSLSADESCDGNTYEVAVCLLRVVKSVDSELNAVYQEALKNAQDFYTLEDARNLRDAERKWIAYRDAACKAELGLLGRGTAGPATHSLCLIRITKERTAALRHAYLMEDPKN